MTLAPRDTHQHWTIEDYQSLDDDNRYEILRGRLIMVPAPATAHQQVITQLGTQINSHVHANGLGVCFHAPFDVYLAKDTVVQPDFTFVSEGRRSEVLGSRGAVDAPDLVVEVLSTSTTSRDRGEKRSIYADAGVSWLLIVDPDGLTVEVYHLNERGEYVWIDTAVGPEELTFDLFPDLTVDLGEVWPSDRLEEFVERQRQPEVEKRATQNSNK